MKYLKSCEKSKSFKNMTYDELLNYRKTLNYTPSEKLLHLLADEIYTQWKRVKERNNDDYSLFYKEFKKISPKKVEKLINEGADINAYDKNWGSLIKLAVYRQDLPLIKCLIENGANVNGTDKDRVSSSPLYIAAGINYPPTPSKILKYLIKKDADINLTNDGSVLPMHHALFRNCFENATILLKAGSVLTSKSHDYRNKDNDINHWTKKADYEFQKTLCQMYPEEISKIDDNKIDSRIKEEFSHLFTANKFNL